MLAQEILAVVVAVLFSELRAIRNRAKQAGSLQ
jgi:hypothetical protein